MNVFSTIRHAAGTVRAERALWFFGFFAASAGGAGTHVSRSGAGETPSWLVAALVAVALLAIVSTVLHVVSESALIDGVRRTRRGESYSISAGLRSGLGSFWRMAGVKLSALGAALATAALVALPALAVALAGGPLWAGAIGSTVLALVALPWLLSLYFIYEYSMRALVVEDLGVRAALREGLGFLHGRVGMSLSLAVASGVGQLAAGAAGIVLAIPVAALAGLTYLAFGSIAALVVGGALMIPLAACLAGALGTYRSSVWTHAYLEERGLTS